MKKLTGLILLFTFCFNPPSLHAQKFEAENAALSGGATVISSASRSNGKYVAQNGGNLIFNINIGGTGYYDIYINAAAPGGSKINGFFVDGNSINFSTSNTDYESTKLVPGLRLTSGAHTLKIIKSWGYIDIDYIELKSVSASDRFNSNTALVTPEPTDQVQRLYQFIYDNYGSRIISGVMTLNSMDEVNWLKTNTGKEPALVGLDFMHCNRGYAWYNEDEPLNDAKNYYLKNGIAAFNWHWRDPMRDTEEFYTDKTDFDVNHVFDESSAEYQAMISDIDYISAQFKKLQDDGVPAIWRPLHEAAGGWFWWGAKGPAPCKKLWQVMYDRMVNHNGVKNLIWVWTREPNDDAWYPGDEYVDIVSRDIYKDGDHTSQILEFTDMNERYGRKKMITLSECGSFPDPDNLKTDGAAWSWFMPWYGGFVRDSKYNSLTLWQKTMDHEYVVTLDEMPDLKTYIKVPRPEPEPDPDPVLTVERGSSTIKIYPTATESAINIESSGKIGKIKITDHLGRTVLVRELAERSAKLDISGLAPGLYYLRISGQDQAFRIIRK
jgi:mannan endo-1,4-beta-mannosidase